MFPDLVVGEWYLAATCKACKCKIVLFPDLNNGKGNIAGSFAIVCPRCRCPGSFNAEHYHHSETRNPELYVEVISATSRAERHQARHQRLVA